MIIGTGPELIYENPAGSVREPTLKTGDQIGRENPGTSQNRGSSGGASYARTTNQRFTVADANAVSKIMVNRQLSGGQDLDGTTGDEGISLMIQPLDSAGTVLKAAGQVSVRIDEDLGGVSDRQIGLWEFTADEIRSFLVRDDYSEQGILLHLPWNTQIPENRRIKVLVRFVTPDRKNLETTIEFNIDPPPRTYSVDDPVIANWIENDDRWRDLESPTNQVPAESSGQRISDVESAQPRVSAPEWRPIR
jgi:hypothetical protein